MDFLRLIVDIIGVSFTILGIFVTLDVLQAKFKEARTKKNKSFSMGDSDDEEKSFEAFKKKFSDEWTESGFSYDLIKNIFEVKKTPIDYRKCDLIHKQKNFSWVPLSTFWEYSANAFHDFLFPFIPFIIMVPFLIISGFLNPPLFKIFCAIFFVILAIFWFFPFGLYRDENQNFSKIIYGPLNLGRVKRTHFLFIEIDGGEIKCEMTIGIPILFWTLNRTVISNRRNLKDAVEDYYCLRRFCNPVESSYNFSKLSKFEEKLNYLKRICFSGWVRTVWYSWEKIVNYYHLKIRNRFKKAEN